MILVNQMKNTSISIALACLSGLFLYFSWPSIGIFPLLFVGFVPLFFALERLSAWDSKWRLLVLLVAAFLAHIIWIGGSFRWIHAASPKSYQIAVITESLTLMIALAPILSVKKRLGEKAMWIYFVAAYMTVEWINQHWMMGTPYFLLGSGLGMYPKLIQIYEYIGVEGGSLFILLVNLGFFFVLKNRLAARNTKYSWLFLAAAIFPFVLSTFINANLEGPIKNQIKVAALHTYMETYSEESHKNPELVVDSLWGMSRKANLNDIDIIVWPETIISNMGWVNNLANEKAYASVSEKLAVYPDLSICFGGYGFSEVLEKDKDAYTVTDAARGFHYTSHNLAVSMNSSGRWPVRGKEIFIPFQERIPFLDQLPFLKNFADLVGSNTMVSVYKNSDKIHRTAKGQKYAPLLCFESIYPIKMAEYASQSNFLLILSNEFWNKDLSGSDQYMYSHVGMAIQSRTPIVRSCNSGNSVIVDKGGNIVTLRKGKDVGVIRATVVGKTDETFYELIAGGFYKLSVVTIVLIFSALLFNRIFSSKQVN
jgi:apolipoprotein N-acyltransferase